MSALVAAEVAAAAWSIANSSHFLCYIFFLVSDGGFTTFVVPEGLLHLVYDVGVPLVSKSPRDSTSSHRYMPKPKSSSPTGSADVMGLNVAVSTIRQGSVQSTPARKSRSSASEARLMASQDQPHAGCGGTAAMGKALAPSPMEAPTPKHTSLALSGSRLASHLNRLCIEDSSPLDTENVGDQDGSATHKPRGVERERSLHSSEEQRIILEDGIDDTTVRDPEETQNFEHPESCHPSVAQYTGLQNYYNRLQVFYDIAQEENRRLKDENKVLRTLYDALFDQLVSTRVALNFQEEESYHWRGRYQHVRQANEELVHSTNFHVSSMPRSS
ncbi:hypothetical protein Dda_6919 [Drechslerella dactyloides]|uniref:Uncharacterized protein n=1 Tax=Drechslerella dactyloides TaxID=74499 RepID=A0AAD6NH62_DREDA|nr:hypothetical protein Dda_6919 [Drechslerella dactyloides]